MSSEAKISSALLRGFEQLRCFAWKTNDRSTAGIPDIVGITCSGKHLAVETKFVKAWPARSSSMLLTSHEVTRPQAVHMARVFNRGGLAILAIGFPAEEPPSGWSLNWPEPIRGKFGCALVKWEDWVLFATTTSGWASNITVSSFLRLLEQKAMPCTGSMSSALVPWDWGNL